MSTDKDWERWGAADPYFGVLASQKFHTKEMNAASRAEFFQSGVTHVDTTIETIRGAFDRAFTPATALDFGSGVGRLVIPMAQRMQAVLGIDISPSMIAEAEENCRRAGIGNVRFSTADDALSGVDGTFDLVHSHIVLQHIPWRRGRTILRALAERVRPGGYLAVHMLTRCTAHPLVRGLVKVRYALPPLNWLRNALRGRPLLEPAMQLHEYRLPDVLQDLQDRGFAPPVCVDQDLGDFDFDSTVLYARRSAEAANAPLGQPVHGH